MYTNTGLYDDIILHFNCLISKHLKCNKCLYSSDFVPTIYNILFSGDDKDNQLFFDAFKDVETFDKKKIINYCLFNIIIKDDIILHNSDEKKIDGIYTYMEQNRHMIPDIYNYIAKNEKNLPNDTAENLNHLNSYEKLIVNSLCLNINQLSIPKVATILNKINIDFFTYPQSHKEDILELLKLYLPIYDTLVYIKAPKIQSLVPYTKTYSINHVIKLFLKKKDSITFKVLSPKMVIYYLIYQFLINLDADENTKNYVNELLLILKNNSLDASDDTLHYLLNFYNNICDCYSIKERIKNILEIKNFNLHPIINLYASFDATEYENLEQKKKAFYK